MHLLSASPSSGFLPTTHHPLGSRRRFLPRPLHRSRSTACDYFTNTNRKVRIILSSACPPISTLDLLRLACFANLAPSFLFLAWVLEPDLVCLSSAPSFYSQTTWKHSSPNTKLVFISSSPNSNLSHFFLQHPLIFGRNH